MLQEHTTGLPSFMAVGVRAGRGGAGQGGDGVTVWEGVRRTGRKAQKAVVKVSDER